MKTMKMMKTALCLVLATLGSATSVWSADLQADLTSACNAWCERNTTCLSQGDPATESPAMSCPQFCGTATESITAVYSGKVASGKCTVEEASLAVKVWAGCLSRSNSCDIDHDCDRATAYVLSDRCWE